MIGGRLVILGNLNERFLLYCPRHIVSLVRLGEMRQHCFLDSHKSIYNTIGKTENDQRQRDAFLMITGQHHCSTIAGQ